MGFVPPSSDSASTVVFVPDEQICGLAGGTTQVGTTEFQYQLKTLRERGPKVCVKTSGSCLFSSSSTIRTTFASSSISEEHETNRVRFSRLRHCTDTRTSPFERGKTASNLQCALQTNPIACRQLNLGLTGSYSSRPNYV
jgi:hypothetical protein